MCNEHKKRYVGWTHKQFVPSSMKETVCIAKDCSFFGGAFEGFFFYPCTNFYFGLFSFLILNNYGLGSVFAWTGQTCNWNITFRLSARAISRILRDIMWPHLWYGFLCWLDTIAHHFYYIGQSLINGHSFAGPCKGHFGCVLKPSPDHVLYEAKIVAFYACVVIFSVSALYLNLCLHCGCAENCGFFFACAVPFSVTTRKTVVFSMSALWFFLCCAVTARKTVAFFCLRCDFFCVAL